MWAATPDPRQALPCDAGLHGPGGCWAEMFTVDMDCAPARSHSGPHYLGTGRRIIITDGIRNYGWGLPSEEQTFQVVLMDALLLSALQGPFSKGMY